MQDETEVRLAAYVAGLQEALRRQTTQWPFFFLSTYKKCGLNDTEAMFVLQLHHFLQTGNDFPLLDEVAAQMSNSAEAMVGIIEKLMRFGYLSIDQVTDETTGIQSEKYNVQALMDKALRIYASEQFELQDSMQVAMNRHVPAGTKKQPTAVSNHRSMYSLFQEEFGRLLSPLECEMIQKWLDEEKYPSELIRHALREAVFSGKLHFRYIDRILLEWRHKNIQTVDDAKRHAANFRGF